MLSATALKLLKWMAEDGDDENGYERELICEGRSWMAGINRVSKRTAMELLAHLCISRDSYSGDSFERFTINGTGRKVLADPKGLNTLKKIIAASNQPKK